MKWRATVKVEGYEDHIRVTDKNGTRGLSSERLLPGDYYTFLFEAEPPFRLATDREKFEARVEPADNL